MDSFTPVESTIGGMLIGLSAALLLLFTGRIAGISGIAGGLLTRPPRSEVYWRALFIGGLVLGGLVMSALAPSLFEMKLDRSMLALVAAGLFVGFGTRLGSGCTSGHGVCGISRMSPRSIAATLTFMATGAAVVYVVNHLVGGSL